MCQKNDFSHRQCVICNKQLIGRSDKRFCDIKCKNYYHSEVRKSVKTIASETMKVLAKNIVILEGVMGEEKNSCLIDTLALERLGFRFNYITDVGQKYGITNYSVFGFNYRFVKNKRVEITIDRKRSPISPFIFKRWSREISETSV
jgi:predicted nucleic acid-binding Zn ribbon protein